MTALRRHIGLARAAPEPSARQRTPSTRLQILGWYMVLLAIVIAFGLLIQRSILISQVNADIDAQLRQEVEELEQLAGGRDPNTGDPFGTDVRALFTTFINRNLPVEGEALFTLVDGKPFASSVSPLSLFDYPEVVDEWASITTPTRGEFPTDAGRVRYLAAPVVDGDRVLGVFVVTFFLDTRLRDVDQVLRTGALVYGSAFIVASAFAWFAAGRVLRPVRLLTSTARSISESNWSDRIPVRGQDEIAHLARTFNDMLDRLESAFATQREFMDDAGHELRTPITIIRGHLEILDIADPAERRETLDLVMDELDRMSRMVEDLLLLAKASRPDFLDLHPLDVADFTQELWAKARALGNRDWRLVKSSPAVIVADKHRLTQAIMNLVQNAVQHTSEGDPILLGSRSSATEIAFWVADAGEGIPPGDQRRIFDRFARGATSRRRTEGAGLGLAIVQAITTAHGGRLTLNSSLGKGSRFTITLPIEPPRATPT